MSEAKLQLKNFPPMTLREIYPPSCCSSPRESPAKAVEAPITPTFRHGYGTTEPDHLVRLSSESVTAAHQEVAKNAVSVAIHSVLPPSPATATEELVVQQTERKMPKCVEGKTTAEPDYEAFEAGASSVMDDGPAKLANCLHPRREKSRECLRRPMKEDFEHIRLYETEACRRSHVLCMEYVSHLEAKEEAKRREEALAVTRQMLAQMMTSREGLNMK